MFHLKEIFMNSKHIFLSTLVGPLVIPSLNAAETNRPNILFVISDDQSYPHASAYGSPIAKHRHLIL